MTIQKYILSLFVFLFTVVVAFSQEITNIVDQKFINKHFGRLELPKTQEEIKKFLKDINNINEDDIIVLNVSYRLPEHKEWKEKVTDNNPNNKFPSFVKKYNSEEAWKEMAKEWRKEVIPEYNERYTKGLPSDALLNELNDSNILKVLTRAREDGDMRNIMSKIIKQYFNFEDHKELGEDFYYYKEKISSSESREILKWQLKDENEMKEDTNKKEYALRFSDPSEDENWLFRLVVIGSLKDNCLKDNWFYLVRENRRDTNKLEKYAGQIKRITENEKVKVADNVIKIYQSNIPNELKDQFFKYYAAVKDTAR